MIQDIINLSIILGMAGMNGHIALMSARGLLTKKNIVLIATTFIAGPAAMISSALTDGSSKERILVALSAGLIATIIVIIAALLGPKLSNIANMEILKIVGGIAIMLVAFSILGLKIPGIIPTAIIILGMVFALVWR
jgi:hypothetical protein